MSDTGLTRTWVVPRPAAMIWTVGLISLPAMMLWLDPYADAIRTALLALPGATPVLKAAVYFGKFDSQMLMILPAFLLAWRARWRPAVDWLKWTLAAVLAQALVVSALKVLVQRERPPVVSDQLPGEGLQAMMSGKSMSFPSGDTASVFAIACVLAAYVPWLRTPAMVIACVVGISRIARGCHYPSDVLAGALVGSLIAALILTATRARRIVVT